MRDLLLMKMMRLDLYWDIFGTVAEASDFFHPGQKPRSRKKH
jgi:hypothetical protein